MTDGEPDATDDSGSAEEADDPGSAEEGDARAEATGSDTGTDEMRAAERSEEALADAEADEYRAVPAEAVAEMAEEPAGDVQDRLAAISVDPRSDSAAEAEEGLLGDLDASLEPDDIEIEDELIEEVAELDTESLARLIRNHLLRIAALEGELEELQDEVEDLESRLARKQADFQNYKKRQQERLEDEKARATEDLVTRLLDVRDNLSRALDQDEDAEIRDGVESTLRQLDEEFERENVAVIEPEPGDETDPQRHEVLVQVESDQPVDTVVDIHRPGYEMGEKVLRPAQVTVSGGDGATPEGD